MGKEVGKREQKGNGAGCSPEGECECWVLHLKAGILGEVSGKGFNRIFISSSDQCALSDSWSPLIG